MKLKKVIIKNYRQFIDNVELNLEDTITVLAGSNNSGKTSIVELFNKLFFNNSFSINDIPVYIKNQICNDLQKMLCELKDENVDNWVNNIYDYLLNDSSDEQKKNEVLRFKNELISKQLEIKIEISYTEDEDISLFSDYLMDLEENTKSFFFLVRFEFDYNKLCEKSNIKDLLSDKSICLNCKRSLNLESKIIEFYIKSSNICTYYTDKDYKNEQKMESLTTLSKCFNFKYIPANIELPDEIDKKKENLQKNASITKSTIDYLKNDETEWKQLIDKLPNKIIDLLGKNKISEKSLKKSVSDLQNVINDIKNTNGGRKEELSIILDIKENVIKDLFEGSFLAKYEINGLYLDERFQGLGYVHLIYIILSLNGYLQQIKSNEINNRKVNFYIIEEPESHMHPQMQKVFIEKMKEKYNEENIQGMITTHSSEIVKETDLKNLRVVRPSIYENDDDNNCIFSKRICDMNIFLNEIVTGIDDIIKKDDLKKMYNLLFNIVFSNLIFADKAIIFEGDTERMYLQKVITLPRYKKLSKQYIAYIQCGGAYAHWYSSIINYFNIKTLIITDIDYNKELTNIEEIKNSEISNEALKFYYKLYKREKDATISKDEKIDVNAIYEWQNEKSKEKNNNLFNVVCQTDKDNYTRTLEEAMLTKLYKINLEKSYTHKEWVDKKVKYNLNFVCSTGKKDKSAENTKNKEDTESVVKKDKFTVRNIVESTSNKKTDFMFSVIIGELVQQMLPKYIAGGLEWLI